MCGIFGFIGPSPNQGLLRHLAAEAGRRGPHACGWAFREGQGRMAGFRVERRHGELGRYVSEIPAAPIVVGHSRLATTGGYSYRDLTQAQPLTSPPAQTAPDGDVLVHNGVARLKDLVPGQSDSQVLMNYIGLLGLPLAMNMLPAADPFAVILARRDGRIITGRRGSLPLFFRTVLGQGVYLCSLEFEGSQLMADGELAMVSLGGGINVQEVKERRTRGAGGRRENAHQLRVVGGSRGAEGE